MLAERGAPRPAPADLANDPHIFSSVTLLHGAPFPARIYGMLPINPSPRAAGDLFRQNLSRALRPVRTSFHTKWTPSGVSENTTDPSAEQAKFQRLLRELFQCDCTDLGFGIYRIMNHKELGRPRGPAGDRACRATALRGPALARRPAEVGG